MFEITKDLGSFNKEVWLNQVYFFLGVNELMTHCLSDFACKASQYVRQIYLFIHLFLKMRFLRITFMSLLIKQILT